MTDHCLLTGAGSGIGQAIALRLAERKIPMLLVGRPHSIEKTCAMVHARGGSAELVPGDLNNYEAIREPLSAIISAQGQCRWGVVLAAAMLGDSSLASYEKVFRTNVVGNLAVLEACLPQMTQAGFGRVVFFAGGGAAYAYPAFPAYALSKVSTVRLVENLAATYRPASGLSFVCLAPGAVDTPLLAKVMAAGGEVKTKTNIAEPVGFVEAYLRASSCSLSGRYIHVRDDWVPYLDGSKTPVNEQFFLRRTS